MENLIGHSEEDGMSASGNHPWDFFLLSSLTANMFER